MNQHQTVFTVHADELTPEFRIENAIIFIEFSSLAMPDIVKMATYSAATDDNFIEMTIFPFHWWYQVNHKHSYD